MALAITRTPLALAAFAVFGLAACTATPQDAPAPQPPPAVSSSQPPVSTAKPATATPATITVPTDLVGATLGEAKARLATLGFTNVVVAGGTVTDADPVASVSEAGKRIAPDAAVVVVGTPPTPAPAQREPSAPQSSEADTTAGCGQRAVNAGQFNPSCSEYQGYLDPGTIAGRGPTSGEKQFQHGCEQGYIPREQCE